jgi:HD-GYP domain-containing protein (c-di-GMP phosphodiesterase class II)
MPKISPTEAKPGMILASPIRRAKDGLVLLQESVTLNSTFIQQIRKLDLESIWVQNYPIDDETEGFESIKDQTRLNANSILRTSFQQLKENQNFELTRIQDLVNDILDFILGNSYVVFSIHQINSYDNYTFSHSVHVCVLSLMIGAIMELGRNELEILGISALLHDIGKIFIDFRVLNKPGALNPEEYEKIKTHTQEGYQALKKRAQMSFLIPHMALQHHEREDGSGYPRGLSSRRIHRFAKIIAVADVFDAMTSARVYKKPVSPSVAIQAICKETPLKFNQAVVDSLKRILTPYSKGSVLVLSNHQTVEVVSISKYQCLIRVIAGINEGEIYNLYQKPEVSVVRRVC